MDTAYLRRRIIDGRPDHDTKAQATWLEGVQHRLADKLCDCDDVAREMLMEAEISDKSDEVNEADAAIDDLNDEIHEKLVEGAVTCKLKGAYADGIIVEHTARLEILADKIRERLDPSKQLEVYAKELRQEAVRVIEDDADHIFGDQFGEGLPTQLVDEYVADMVELIGDEVIKVFEACEIGDVENGEAQARVRKQLQDLRNDLQGPLQGRIL